MGWNRGAHSMSEAHLRSRLPGEPAQSRRVVTLLPTVQRIFGLLRVLDAATVPAEARFVEVWTASPSEFTPELRRSG